MAGLNSVLWMVLWADVSRLLMVMFEDLRWLVPMWFWDGCRFMMDLLVLSMFFLF
jgi:hypothetical protein